MATFTAKQQAILDGVSDDTQSNAEFTAKQQAILDGADASGPTALQKRNFVPIPEPIVLGLEGEEDRGKGPLGLVSPKIRKGVRKGIEGRTGFMQLVTELAPSLAGAAGGAAALSPLGPPGMIVGAVGGGLFGEVMAQESGIAPESDLNLALAGGGPLLGPAVGGTVKLGGKVTSLGTKLPFVKAALGQSAVRESGEATVNLGANILTEQTGLMARPAKSLFKEVRDKGLVVGFDAVERTRTQLRALIDDLNDFREVPQTRAAIRLLERNYKKLVQMKNISLDDLVEMRKDIGREVGNASKAGGTREFAAKKAFAAIAQDMDDIAKFAGETGDVGKVAVAAIEKSKLEFAVKNLERQVSKFSKDVVQGDELATEVNMAGLSKFLRDISDKSSKLFDKNFVDALGPERILTMRKNAAEMVEIMSTTTPGGPGGLVARGAGAKGARQIAGALLGFSATGGPIGTLAGIMGANLPEVLVALLSSPRAIALLKAAKSAGKGKISHEAWVAVGTILTRSAGVQGGPNEPFATGDQSPAELGIEGAGA